MRKLGIFLPLLGAFVATPALAQDLGISGRAELRVGYDNPRADLTVQNESFTSDFGVKGLLIGAEAGVDARISDGFLVGAYVGIETSKADDCVERPFFAITSSRNDNVCLDAGRNLTGGVRAGVPMGDGGLIYVKGGLSKGRFQGSYTNTPTPTTGNPSPAAQTIFQGSDNVNGYHFGGGFELNFGGNFYGKAEYVHHRYDKAFVSAIEAGRGGVALPPNVGPDVVDPSRHQLVVGIGIRFGGAR